jgi:threonine dehydratase
VSAFCTFRSLAIAELSQSNILRNKTMLRLEEINQASAILEGIAFETPLVYSNYLSSRFDAKVYLKLENLQRTGSFKFRGAYHKLTKANKNTRHPWSEGRCGSLSR